jgi:ABC-type uncharacterized transport system ATPase subunit
MQQDFNILQVDNLSKYFGGLAAVSNCSLKIKKVLSLESLDQMDQEKQLYLI